MRNSIYQKIWSFVRIPEEVVRGMLRAERRGATRLGRLGRLGRFGLAVCALGIATGCAVGESGPNQPQTFSTVALHRTAEENLGAAWRIDLQPRLDATSPTGWDYRANVAYVGPSKAEHVVIHTGNAGVTEQELRPGDSLWVEAWLHDARSPIRVDLTWDEWGQTQHGWAEYDVRAER
ncbi:hypothetical protein [Alicyclobacillus macrosporangiidus]|uniref:hypothetical protein n=1 Tax=Alicyclobacillus macrosporangiidus TaxID=392015 RepID=UPI0004965AB9|nr:hypothetical protein [Alicyclobacillus macrosporangiidus]